MRQLKKKGALYSGMAAMALFVFVPPSPSAMSMYV
jgi:hypothetical protein